MAQEVTTARTTLPSEEVIVRAIHFFTNEKWRVQTQSAMAATFVGGRKFKWGRTIVGIILCLPGLALTFSVFLAFIGIPLIIIGAILVISGQGGIRTKGSLTGPGITGTENIVVSATRLEEGADVTITYSKQADKLVDRFISVLPR